MLSMQLSPGLFVSIDRMREFAGRAGRISCVFGTTDIYVSDNWRATSKTEAAKLPTGLLRHRDFVLRFAPTACA